MSKEHTTESHDHPLEARLARLEELFVRFAQTGTVEYTLGHGLDSVTQHLCTMNHRLECIAAELMPLRTLSGTPVPLTEKEDASLHSMSRALARPNFKQKSLTAKTVPARFVGGSQFPGGDDPLIENRSAAS